MFMRNIFLVILLGVLSIPGNLLAQETEKQRMIGEIVNASDAMAQIDQFKGIIAQQMEKQLSQSGVSLTAEKNERFLEIVFTGVDEMILEMMPMAFQFYDSKFTAEEINEIHSYITSPTGKKLIALTPEFTNMLMMEMTPKMMERMPQMQQELLELFTNKDE